MTLLVLFSSSTLLVKYMLCVHVNQKHCCGNILAILNIYTKTI